ncbi:hypothetical protein QLQ12_27770 [Actinoplanes sp. NEAU-A12]|uniref:Uncharacterized protein n=1 Tax=Actinoplanes sandaracinus TaxID=3045177 RepID=A0ABT6WRQ2_9ACTN|nr:hypothetical protein [Actinoplanes sandaracinus]MDI6102423.1 hypothetical protein [Actinoplanes sandaracinus]
MADTVVEIHVPLTPTPGLEPGAYPFPWIDQIEEFLAESEEDGSFEVADDGEEFGEVYVFFLRGADEAMLLGVASRVAALDGVPAGAFAMVTDNEAAEYGLGRRVGLPLT